MKKTQRPDTGAFERSFSRERLTVLVVDDEPVLSQQVRRSLSAEAGDGAEVIRAASLAAGLLAVAERKIDVILLDPFLCSACGLQSTVMMVRGARAVPIILVVPGGAEELGLRALQFGVLAMVARDMIGERRLLPLLRWAIDRHARLQSSEQRSREKALREALAICGPSSACCPGDLPLPRRLPAAVSEQPEDDPRSAEAA